MLEPMSNFTLNRAAFAAAIRGAAECDDVDQASLDDFAESSSEAISTLVSLAQDAGAVEPPEDLAALDLEIVVYAHDDEYDDNLMVAVRPRMVRASTVPSFLRTTQVATMVNETRGYVPRGASGERAHGVDALAAVVEMVLEDANGTLPDIRAGIAGWTSSEGVPPESARQDAVALDRIAGILRDPEWGVGMLEDIAEAVVSSGRSLENPTAASSWTRH